MSWHGQAVGRQQETLRQLPTGEWLVELTLTVEATVRDAPLRYQETEQMQFAATPPYRLLRGQWQRQQNALLAKVQYENGANELTGSRTIAEQHSALRQPALDFGMADYYAASALVRQGAAVGSRQALKRLNSETLQLFDDEVTVLETGSRWFGTPYRLSWKRAGERWQAEWLFSAGGMPLAMNVGDAIRLELADAEVAPAPQDLYLGRTIHADRALGRAREVVSLQLRWPQTVSLPLTSSPGQTTLPGFVRTDNRQPGLLAPLLEWQAALAPEPRYSPADERLQLVAKQLVQGAADDHDKVSRLLNFVSQHLRQQDVLTDQTAADIFRSRRGDCTEFSQLFVALARAAAMPAREVSGLVYLGDEVQGFGGHSWAEVIVDGRWLAVDPMWNLLPVSGTHLRMGSGDEGALAAALARRDLQFSVEQISYR
ncbi:transglutaminase domain-containing protein [Permianibacter sp. IMCC34836]|uniref:transglutaminase-like domain-containing protein n=1 Tax=Permianibacter fluminis TaxID=2738515 RepID=UPI001554D006|nr:transglutaminase-like domain-containing protein [Permianibacter fluminis]NQD38837.1 transglutaminase domain-containing protein [Permianibacter fluminis]